MIVVVVVVGCYSLAGALFKEKVDDAVGWMDLQYTLPSARTPKI